MPDRARDVRRAAFILCLAAACAGPTQATAPDAEPHLGDAWYVFRADDLGISVDAARRRDQTISTFVPPALDATMAVEGAALWRELCAKCHGDDGRGAPDADFTPPPKKWGGMGVRMGFFFGGDKMRAGVYRRIRHGGIGTAEQPSAMPAWRDHLSREQTWALVRHIEGF